MTAKLILASQSPRRHQLLSQLGYQFTCQVANIDESVLLGESPHYYVERLAIAKAQKIAAKHAGIVVLGSDTSVVVDNEILGKPESEADCISMLSKLSGRKHQVLTSIAAVKDEQVVSKVVSTDVYFKSLTTLEIKRYWQSEEPKDKAGGYGIQGIGGQFVKQIHGCYFAVVGLPLYETAQLLAKFGLATPIQTTQKEG